MPANPHPRPALGAVMVQTIAANAATEGLTLAASFPEDASCAEQAHAAVQALADRVMPARGDDESPGAWYRRGVRDGIMNAWEGRSFAPPTVPMSDLELYSSGHSLACTVVLRVMSEGVRHGG